MRFFTWLRWLRVLGVCFSTLCLAAASADAAPVGKPNFIFVLIDDMGWADLSCYGNQSVKTANLDRLAAEGLRFHQYYVASPICSPSRTGLTTGQFPARWRITSYLASRQENEKRGMPQWLDPQALTLARMLRGAGYATGHFGKWHMGGQRDVGEAPLITQYGFEESLTQFEGLGDRVLAMLDDFDGKPPRKMPLGIGSEKLGRGQITWLERWNVTGAFVQRALEFIKKAEAAGQPFYVNVWPDDVHSPFFPPKELRGDGSKRQLYHGALVNMDRQLGPLFDYVRQSPTLRERTLILVSSDNGPEPGAGSTGRLRGHKGNLYEGGIRDPLLVWGPGFIPSDRCGRTNEESVIGGVDLAPSILRLAGVPIPAGLKLDGEDLSDSLLGKAEQVRQRPLLWIRPPDRAGDAKERWPDLAIRDGDWKLLMMENGASAQLYNIARNPGETNNLAAVYPDRTEQLRAKLFAWRKELPPGLLPRADAAAPRSP